jgi:hypothetical protein
MRPMFSSEKNSDGDVTPAMVRANPSIASWLPGIAVRSDDHVGVLGDELAALAVAAHAGHTSVLDDDIVDGETLPNLRSRLGRSVHEQFVEHGHRLSITRRIPL